MLHIYPAQPLCICFLVRCPKILTALICMAIDLPDPCPAQLYFAALLRLPRQMSKAAKLERVNTVITALGLDKCKNTIIGERHNHDLLCQSARTCLDVLGSRTSAWLPCSRAQRA